MLIKNLLARLLTVTLYSVLSVVCVSSLLVSVVDVVFVLSPVSDFGVTVTSTFVDTVSKVSAFVSV